jgi:hypothetical protein
MKNSNFPLESYFSQAKQSESFAPQGEKDAAFGEGVE